ncbi:MAG: hypothetical protein ICV73_12490 [Acetobacteraceae bacterium]|nr:hypothetical protein [Acetobacteraceae bacterium]
MDDGTPNAVDRVRLWPQPPEEGSRSPARGAAVRDAGTTVHVPAGVPHNFGNRSATPARMLMVIAPAGFENFFAEVGTPGRADGPTPAPVGAATIARLQATAPKYGGTTFLPPASVAGR